MNSSDNRNLRTALIPWVFALVALFGVNALVPDHSRSRRNETSDEIGISQPADNAQIPGRTFNPLVFVVPDFSSGFGFLNSSTSILRIEARRDVPLVRSLEGSIQGRAPPVVSLS